jgi:hypothetical protein
MRSVGKHSASVLGGQCGAPALRIAASPRPAKPSSSKAQVDGSGTPSEGTLVEDGGLVVRLSGTNSALWPLIPAFAPPNE